VSLQRVASFEKLHELLVGGFETEASSMIYDLDIRYCDDVNSVIDILIAAYSCDDEEFIEHIILNIPNKFTNDFIVNLKTADLYAKFNNSANAELFYKKASHIRPRNAWSYFLHGRYLTKHMQFSQAQALLADGLSMATEADSGADIMESLQRDYVRFRCYEERADIRYGQAILNRRFFPGRPVHNALFVAMVKDEGDIIFECLRSAYRTGLRNFLVANNGSTDTTDTEILRFIKTFEDATVVVLTDPIVGYWQDKKMNAFWRFAVDYFAIRGTKIDWVFPIDADELLVQAREGQDLYSLLNSDTVDKVTLLYGMWCLATPENIHDDWLVPGDINTSFPVLSGYESSTDMKIAFRPSAAANLKMGNHFAAGCVGDASTVFSLNEQGIFLIHHPIRSRRQFRSKIVNGMKALEAATTLGASNGAHWRETYSRYASEGDRYIDLVLQNSYEKNSHLSAEFAREVQSSQNSTQCD
jgi:glycosyltransferase involved in cell wall biosynthesis